MSSWRWGTPAEYAWLHKDSAYSPAYQRRLLRWLEVENPKLHVLVMKELARDPVRKHRAARNSGEPEKGEVD